MISNQEKILSKYFKKALKAYNIGDIVQDSEDTREATNNLEFYLSLLFCFEYKNEWRHKSLDGIYSGYIYKIGNNELELTGMCIFIDQTLTPLYVRLKLNKIQDRIDFIHSKLGEYTSEGLMKIPYNSSKWGKYMYSFDVDRIDWAYEVKQERNI